MMNFVKESQNHFQFTIDNCLKIPNIPKKNFFYDSKCKNCCKDFLSSFVLNTEIFEKSQLDYYFKGIHWPLYKTSSCQFLTVLIIFINS